MLDRLLKLVYQITRYRAYLVIGVFLILVILSLVYIFPFPVRSSLMDLLPQDDPIINEYRRREETITQTQYVLVALSIKEGVKLSTAEKKQELINLAQELKPLLKKSPEINTVHFQRDVTIPEKHRLLYSLNDSTLNEVNGLQEKIESFSGRIHPTEETDPRESYSNLLERFQERDMDENLSKEETKRWLSELESQNESFIDHLRALDEVAPLGEDVSTLLDYLDRVWEKRRKQISGAYFSPDNSTLLVRAKPTAAASYNIEFSQKVTHSARKAISKLKSHPQYDEDLFEIGLTGSFVMNTERNSALRVDMLKTTIISSAGIMVAFFFALGSLFYSVLIGFPLVVAVVFSLGWAKFSVNGFNLLTTFLPALVLGLSIDYGIHLLFRYTEERGDGKTVSESVKTTILRQGKGIFIAALTTSGVFATLIFSRSRGLVEMGIITSPGIMISFFVYLFLLPALLVAYQRWRRRRQVVLLFDYRAKLRGFVNSILSWRTAVLVVALVVSGLALFSALHLRFQFASTDVSTEVEASIVDEKVQQKFSGTGINVGTSFVFFSDSIDQLKHLDNKLQDIEVVTSVSSIDDYLPENLEALKGSLYSGEQATNFEGLLDALEDETKKKKDYISAVEGLIGDLSSAQFSATLSSQSDLSLQISHVIDQLLDIRQELLQINPEEMEGDIHSLQSSFRSLKARLDKTSGLLEDVNSSADLVKFLPESVRSNYVSEAGEYISIAQVEEDIYESGVLNRFTDQVSGMTDDYFGLPLIQSRLERHIKRDFFLSSLFALFIISALLFRGIRNLRLAVLAMIPLILGYLWMLGGMNVLGMNFNFINIIISPLLIGIGVDDGIHLIYRWQEENETKKLKPSILDAFSHTGLAIITTSITTIAVFGSLLIARTPGLRILGLTALLGIGFAMVLSLTVLPAVLYLAFTGDEK